MSRRRVNSIERALAAHTPERADPQTRRTERQGDPVQPITHLAAPSMSASTAATVQAPMARVAGRSRRAGTDRSPAARAQSQRTSNRAQERTSVDAHRGVRARAQMRGCADAHLLAASQSQDVAPLGWEGRS
jgi:hypothetical protein